MTLQRQASPVLGDDVVLPCPLEVCPVVLVHLPGRIPAHVRHRLENTTRRTGSVLLTTGGMGRSSLRLRVTRQSWLGAEYGYGRLRGRLAQMVADGRGTLARPQRSWPWLPGPDGMVTAANQALFAPAVANYIAKYATKTLTVPGMPDKRIRTAFDLQGLRCSRRSADPGRGVGRSQR